MSNNKKDNNKHSSYKSGGRAFTVNKKEDIKTGSHNDEYCSVHSCSSTCISDVEWRSTQDILDLEIMSEQMIEKKISRISSTIDEEELRRYTVLAEADFGEIEKTDFLLEQAYDLYFAPGLDEAPRVKRKTEAMIARLERKPHFYCPYEREETTEVHVSRWLNKYTCNPQEELLGFTSKDPFEPKRYIAATEPRACTSDTNMVLGKRKRARDDEWGVEVSKCSSELRLVRDIFYRPKKARRSR